MFDLTEALRRWRARMAAQPGIGAGDLDELEDHLRESMTELRDRGLSEEDPARVVGSEVKARGAAIVLKPERVLKTTD